MSLDEELQTLDLYLSLEQLRTQHHFAYEIKLSPELDPYQLEIPPGLLQPFLENAIWHGLMPKEENAKLWLTIDPIDSGLEIRIRDNGIGRQAAQERQEASEYRPPSKGMAITEARVEMLNRLYDQQLSLEIQDMKTAEAQPDGTLVCLRIQF
ncbi:MAG: hypothetical protein AAFQ68_04745 [Bacteroidota bacterium]